MSAGSCFVCIFPLPDTRLPFWMRLACLFQQLHGCCCCKVRKVNKQMNLHRSPVGTFLVTSDLVKIRVWAINKRHYKCNESYGQWCIIYTYIYIHTHIMWIKIFLYTGRLRNGLNSIPSSTCTSCSKEWLESRRETEFIFRIHWKEEPS